MPGGLTRLRFASAPALLVVLAAVIPYVPTLGSYFVQDDFGVVWLLSGKPWTTFPHWFAGTWMDDIWGYTPDEVRPFPALSYQLAAALGPGSAWPNHAINVAMHAINAVLVFRIAETAGGLRRGAAALAGGLFAVCPIQAESVAWITGRVDSLPAAFYFAAFLQYATWRRGGRRSAYWWSVAWCFAALFSKQNAITLAPALVAYDLIQRPAAHAFAPSNPRTLARSNPRTFEPSHLRTVWTWVRPYVPYVALTAGYLWLRYVLFGQVAREETLTAQRFHDFAADSASHLKRLVFGDLGMGHAGPGAVTAVLAFLGAVWLVARLRRTASAGALTRTLIYFGVAWTALGMAPILVSGYYSPRHMYLASVGWAIVLGAASQLLWELGSARAWRTGVAAMGAAVIGAYTVQLADVVRDWRVRSDVSARAVRDLEREIRAVPAGTLIVAGAPRSSWAFALPFVLRPPFTSRDLSRAVRVVSISPLYCCPAGQWEQDTRAALRAWTTDPARPPVVALYWNPDTGTLSRVADSDDPYLRTLMTVLLSTDDRASLDGAISRMLIQFVAPRIQPRSPAT